MRCRMATNKILDGPSKWNLMLSLLHGDNNSRERVTFMLEGLAARLGDLTARPVKKGDRMEKTKVSIQIDSLQREDGSGETWNFAGYEIVTEWKTHFSPAYGPGPTTGGPRLGRPAKGFFSTRTRTGTIEFEQ